MEGDNLNFIIRNKCTIKNIVRSKFVKNRILEIPQSAPCFAAELSGVRMASPSPDCLGTKVQQRAFMFGSPGGTPLMT